MRDIYEVLRKKQAEQTQLGKQIEALQTAAEHVLQMLIQRRLIQPD